MPRIPTTHGDLKVFVGNFVHSTKVDPLVLLTDTVIGVSGSKIVFVKPSEELRSLIEEYKISEADIFVMNDRQFMIPGFVDTHIHAPQYPNLGLKLDLPLLEWLKKYTYPTEAKFKDVEYARRIYPVLVERLVRNGTTTASYYGSLHLPATKILADALESKGQRALVGKVCMVLNALHDYVEPSVEQSLKETEEFIRYVRNLDSPLVQPVVTPRSALRTPLHHMEALGKMANQYGCPIQSHLSESLPEIAMIMKMYPWSETVTGVYDKAGLLGPKTIMAHGVWLDDADVRMVRESGTGISHCPSANISLRSGLCDVRRLLDNGIKVALGTDCAAGYSISILDSIRQALHTSRILNIYKEDYKSLSLFEVFRIATLGGAQVMSMEDKIGNFEVAKEFDALLIDLGIEDSAVDLQKEDSLEDMVQRFLLNGDDRNIVQVFVAGRKIHERKHNVSCETVVGKLCLEECLKR